MIKRPNGFIVNEIPGDYKNGDHTHFTLWKKNYNTIDAVRRIAKQLRVSIDRFGFAGLKDRNAITTQRVSAWRVPKKNLEKIKIKDIKITKIKEGLEKITIGSHKANKFKIKLNGLKKRDLIAPEKIPNLFGPQRFNGTELLGRKLIERDWAGLVKLLKSSGSYEKKVFAYLRERPGDFLGAVKTVDKRIRVLWVNAWQAKQWNDSIDLSKDKQKLNSYKAIPEMPELGIFPGAERNTIIKISDYKIKELANGVKLEFTLPKGAYATTVIEFITSEYKKRLKR